MLIELQALYDHLGYHFKDSALLQQALRHRSVGQPNNERLEFLGDALLSAIIATELYQQQPTAKEGELSAQRAHLVNGAMLATIARHLELGPFLQLGAGEKKSGGEDRDSILADAVEAIIGAIYLDGGIEACRQSVLNWFVVHLAEVLAAKTIKDAKSRLQEWTQAQHLPLPEYKLEVTGKAHQQSFHVTCCVQGIDYVAKGCSNGRRKAEQQAAEQFLQQVSEQSTNNK